MKTITEQFILENISKDFSEELYKKMDSKHIHILLSTIFLIAQMPVEEIIKQGIQESTDNLFEVRNMCLRILALLKKDGVDWCDIVLQVRKKYGLVSEQDEFSQIMNNTIGGTIQ